MPYRLLQHNAPNQWPRPHLAAMSPCRRPDDHWAVAASLCGDSSCYCISCSKWCLVRPLGLARNRAGIIAILALAVPPLDLRAQCGAGGSGVGGSRSGAAERPSAATRSITLSTMRLLKITEDQSNGSTEIHPQDSIGATSPNTHEGRTVGSPTPQGTCW